MTDAAMVDEVDPHVDDLQWDELPANLKHGRKYVQDVPALWRLVRIIGFQMPVPRWRAFLESIGYSNPTRYDSWFNQQIAVFNNAILAYHYLYPDYVPCFKICQYVNGMYLIEPIECGAKWAHLRQERHRHGDEKQARDIAILQGKVDNHGLTGLAGPSDPLLAPATAKTIGDVQSHAAETKLVEDRLQRRTLTYTPRSEKFRRKHKARQKAEAME